MVLLDLNPSIAIVRIMIFFNFILFVNLKHCISFAKHQNESATGIHVLPIFDFTHFEIQKYILNFSIVHC